MKKFLIAALAVCLPTFVSAQTLLQNYQPGPRLIDGSQLNLMVAAVNKLQGTTGTSTPSVVSKATLNHAPPTADTGTVLQIVGTDATIARTEIDAFAGVPVFTARRADGTIASPTAVLSADEVGSFNVRPYDGTTYGVATRVSSFATENWSATAHGSRIVFSTVPNTTLTLTDAFVIGNDGALTGTSAAASALAVGRLGATTPAFVVDASTATSITGIKIKSAGTGSGVAISAVGEASNGNLTIDAQGSGTTTINATATGNIVLSRATTGISFSSTGGLTAYSATATPAAASAVAALTMGSAAITITWGTGTPSIAAPQGSLYIQTDGSSSSTRLFIRGSSTWIAVTTAS